MILGSRTIFAAIPVLLAALLASQTVRAQDQTCEGTPGAAKLHVIVEGVRSDKGVITATLYGDDAKMFLKSGGELKVWREPATTPTTEMCVWLPGPGTYAVAIYHDANRDNRFVRGTFGPTQDYGFSRNPRLFLGPPSLGAVKFPAGEGETTVTVKLKYP
jgi:uncharacterized protein (DUF2141 family)